MVDVTVFFDTHDIKHVNLILPVLPRKGDTLIFPPGVVEYYNGAEAEDMAYKVRSVDFLIASREVTKVVVNVKVDKK